MIDLKDIYTTDSGYVIKLIMWHQGPLRDFYVEVWKEKECLFNKDVFPLSTARKLFKEKIKEYQ